MLKLNEHLKKEIKQACMDYGYDFVKESKEWNDNDIKINGSINFFDDFKIIEDIYDTLDLNFDNAEIDTYFADNYEKFLIMGAIDALYELYPNLTSVCITEYPYTRLTIKYSNVD